MEDISIGKCFYKKLDFYNNHSYRKVNHYLICVQLNAWFKIEPNIFIYHILKDPM